MENDANTVAESSPAAAPAAVPSGAEAYANWRMTGEVPETPKPEAPAASKESSGAGEKPAESASAPEAESQQEKKPRSSPSGASARSNAETRLNEILADLKRAGLTPAELKAYKREAQQQATQQSQPNAVTEQTGKPAEKANEAPKKPDPSKFATYEEFDAALDKYHEDVADFRAQKAIADYQAQLQQQTAQQAMQQKFADAKTRYGDEAEATITSTAKALHADAAIPAAVKEMIGNSPVLVDVLYAMGSKPADLDEFVGLARTNPAAAIRKLVVYEQLVSAELGSKAGPAAAAPGRDESGKFTPPAKKTTQAPPPPREAAGRAAAQPDEVEAATASNDFTRYRNAANREDLARRRGH